MSVEFFCDFGNVGIDLSDEKHIRHRLQPVSSSEQLQEQLDLFKHALESGQRAKGSITVVALPNVCGVAEISAVHRLFTFLEDTQGKLLLSPFNAVRRGRTADV